MFGFKSKKSVVGVDIGRNMTKIVQLQYEGSGKPNLERCDILETGFGNPEFDGNVKAFIRDQKLGNAMIASSIEDPSMKIRKMDLPKMPDADLIEAIKWNLRDIVDGDVEEFTISFSKIRETEEGGNIKYELMAYAIKREAVEQYKGMLTNLGFHPFFVEPAAVTLASTLERCYGHDEGYVAGVDIGYGKSIFYVIGNGAFVFSRPLINICLEQQEKEPGDFNQKLAIEIQKSIDTFKVNFKMADIAGIYVSGGGALKNEITNYLKENMGIKIDILNPFLSVGNADAFQGVEPALFAQAVALAYLQP